MQNGEDGKATENNDDATSHRSKAESQRSQAASKAASKIPEDVPEKLAKSYHSSVAHDE